MGLAKKKIGKKENLVFLEVRLPREQRRRKKANRKKREKERKGGEKRMFFFSHIFVSLLALEIGHM